MKRGLVLLAILGLPMAVLSGDDKTDVLGFKVKNIKGKEVDLSQYKGKVVLIVNTASKCGLTPQYEGLQKLHKQFAAEGLAILGFPSNDFGAQEPGTEEQISEFCKANYNVEFDMFSKVVVKGEGQCELYKVLTAAETKPKGPGPITWNFEKFLLNRKGEVVARFSPRTPPTDPALLEAIKAELAKN